MSSGVSDRFKRQAAAGKLMDEVSDAIPWSQQVDEASYENLSSQAEKKVTEYKGRPYNSNDSKRGDEKKVNLPNVTKKDNIDNSQRISPRDIQKVVFGDTTGRNGDNKNRNYSPVESSSTTDLNLNKKRITWASVASQPAKPSKKNSNIQLKKKGPGMPPPPMIPGKHNLDINSWEFTSDIPSNDTSGSIPISIPISENANLIEEDVSKKLWKPFTVEQHSTFNRKQPNFYSNKPVKHAKVTSRAFDVSRDRRYLQKHSEEENVNSNQGTKNCIPKDNTDNVCNERDKGDDWNNDCAQSKTIDLSHVLKKLKDRNNYNPVEMDMQKAALSRFFVIKSYSEDDIHRSIKYEIWCSTDHGNKRLDEAFKERVKEGGHIMLFFSVNGSGHFCGMAQMMTSVDYNSTSSVWSQDKWKGKFKVKWIYVKDVPNSQLRHIRLENNDNKSVTNSRDTQEVLNGKGLQVLRILHLYKHQTSIFDDFYHYEKKQEEAVQKKPAQCESYIHAPSSSKVGYNDINDLNMDGFSGYFRERIISHRGGHHNFLSNRRNDRTTEIQTGKDETEKSSNHINQEREDNETNTDSIKRHIKSCSDNFSSSNPNFKDIILHMNNFSCNENNIVGEHSDSKLS